MNIASDAKRGDQLEYIGESTRQLFYGESVVCLEVRYPSIVVQDDDGRRYLAHGQNFTYRPLNTPKISHVAIV